MKIILLTILLVPCCLKLFSQDYQSNIFSKKWYAVKIFSQIGDSSPETQVIPEDGCIGNDNAYYFYIKVDNYGFIKTDHSFKTCCNPQDFRIKDDNLIMYFSNIVDDTLQFKIRYSTEDFLEISGSNSTYFFISDRQAGDY